jgi:carbon dioxide concentrating mechanism protein CcmN
VAETTALPSPWDSEPDSPDVEQASLESIISETVVLEPLPLESPTPPLSESEAPPPPPPNEKPPVVGQVYINQLLVTLFPERDLFKKNS